MINNNICNIFCFLVFFCLVLYKPFVFTKFSEISSENRVQKLGKRIRKNTKNVTNVIIYYAPWRIRHTNPNIENQIFLEFHFLPPKYC